MIPDTFFAPPERSSSERLEQDARVLAEAGIIDHITHVIPYILMVLNRERQIVYSNRRLLELLDIDSIDPILGLRPGELLNCVHAEHGCNGCGTSEFCRECGAVKAILKSQNEQIGVEAECRITTKSGDAIDLRVWASPFRCEDHNFTIFSIMDIKDEKRREALEETFFHDMSNMLTTISGHSSLLRMSEKDPEDARQCIDAIHTATREVINEIQCYQKLVMAESGRFPAVLKQNVESLHLLGEIVRLFPKRSFHRTEESESFTVTTDKSLLFRILLNMVKNAHEAAADDETVTISCRRESTRGIFSVHNPQFMPRSVQLQLFQRSFSTKGPGRGLGTYSMRLFGEKYLKGKVGFNTSEQNGTTFYIALPFDPSLSVN